MRLERLFFDVTLEQLRTVLLAVVGRLDAGLSEEDVESFCADLRTLDPDADLLIEPIVELDGESLPLIVDVFGSESERLEAVFVLAPRLTGIVRERARAVANLSPSRYIPAG